jgi:hypothetical protein
VAIVPGSAPLLRRDGSRRRCGWEWEAGWVVPETGDGVVVGWREAAATAASEADRGHGSERNECQGSGTRDGRRRWPPRQPGGGNAGDENRRVERPRVAPGGKAGPGRQMGASWRSRGGLYEAGFRWDADGRVPREPGLAVSQEIKRRPPTQGTAHPKPNNITKGFLFFNLFGKIYDHVKI